MKKSILSLSAAVALGSLGFAGTANAWVAFDATGAATGLAQHAAGVGHMLFTPYYTANEGLATQVNIVNTDSQNGKVVKVRFRGASNSDDVLDFTLFLSPNDVWAGQVEMDPATGLASLKTSDTSCTIPAADAWVGGVPFKTLRLPSYVSPDDQAALTREGYVEVLNMADIRKDSALYKATKHVAGVAPCSTLDYTNLLSTAQDVSAANSYGLDNPSGGLMGTWAILNLGDLGTFSGAQTAIIAHDGTAPTPGGTYTSATANLTYSPQIEEAIGMALPVDGYTADPLLAGGYVEPLWFDLPDMSTPAFGPFTAPTAPEVQADNLSLALAKASISNEFIATVAGSPVPYSTDWVVSQPTRRYHAAVDYTSAAATSNLVFRGDQSASVYQYLTLDKEHAYGPQACMQMTFSSIDREEGQKGAATPGGAFSPGSAPVVKGYCGEVFVLQLGIDSPLHAAVTVQTATPYGEAGWGTLSPKTASSNGNLPMVGYAAVLFKNSTLGTSFGATFPHRWVR